MKEESISDLENELVDSINSEYLTELTMDIGDLVIGCLSDIQIPFFGTAYKISKVGLNIREHYFVKKVFKFLSNIKDIPVEDRRLFIKEFEKQNFGQRVGETLITLLDRFDNIEKPIFLANLFKAKIENKIDIENFLRLAFIIEKSFLPDLKSLHQYKNDKLYNGHQCESLRSLGLIYQSVLDANGRNNIFSITSLGQDILEYGLKSNFNT